MKFKYLLFMFFTMPGSAVFLYGQDPGCTQFSNAPLYCNPAYTGLYDGFRVRFFTRNQDPSHGMSLRSYHLSADIADRNLPGSGGLGVILNTDNDGLGFIQNYNLGVSFSVRIPLAKSITGQAGFKAALFHKRIAWDEFEMSERVNEKYGRIYDSSVMQPGSSTLNRPDFAIGGLVQFINQQECLSGTVGFAIDHLFEPDQSFNENASSPLPRRYMVHADMIWVVNCLARARSSTDMVTKINPGVVFTRQGDENTLMGGINVTKYGFYLGAWYKGEFGYRQTNAVALLVGYRYAFADNMSIKFTYSYDKQIAGGSQSHVTAHELSLVLEFDNFRLFSGNGRSSIGSAPKIKDSRLASAAF